MVIIEPLLDCTLVVCTKKCEYWTLKIEATDLHFNLVLYTITLSIILTSPQACMMAIVLVLQELDKTSVDAGHRGASLSEQ